MERRKDEMISYVTCKCGAICLTGHDDDGQIHCAKCGNTCLSSEIKHASKEEFSEKIKELRKYERTGWIAYF